MSITQSQARKELARRALPKGDPRRNKRPNSEIMGTTTPALREIAGTFAPPKATKATPKAPVAKVGKAKARVVNPHTAQRAAASLVKRTYWGVTGENLTYAKACEIMGTAKASEGLDHLPLSEQALDMAAKATAHPEAFVRALIASGRV